MAEEAEKIILGDVVFLKSGGPSMTVNNIGYVNTGYFACVWFADNELKTAEFNGISLTKETPKARIGVY